MLKNSIAQRKGRVAVASVSVAIATSVVVGALGISLGIRQKLGAELKAYGANIIVSKKEGYIDETSVNALKGIEGIEDYSCQIYSALKINNMDSEMLGIDLRKTYGWKLTGRRPEEAEALIGADIRDALKLKEESTVGFNINGTDMRVRVSGFVESGGHEDRAVILDLPYAQSLLGLKGKFSAVLVRARTDSLDKALKAISTLIPEAEVKTLRQVAYAEESFLKKIQLLMILVSAVVVIASGISVSSTMSSTMLERIKEIGLMKAIGATGRQIGQFYLMEAGFIGLTGGLTGFLMGFLTAQAVSKAAFQSFINIPFYLIFISLSAGILIAVFASAFPLRPALSQKPSLILRGE